MSRILLLTIAIGSVAAAAALLSPRDQTAPGRIDPAPATIPGVVTGPLPVAAAGPAKEVIDDFDTTGLLQELPSVDEFLALADAAAEQPLSDDDRARVAALLRSDPELRKHFRD